MLPGLSNVLRRDKERQRASALGSTTGVSAGGSELPIDEYGIRREESGGNSTFSQSPNSISTGTNMRRQIGPPQLIGIGPPGPQSPQQQVPRSAPAPGLLPEEHRAREKERERLARAQLSDAHTGQMMANRQLQQEMNSSSAASQVDKNQQTRYSSSHMESSVTRLLVATKMLLEALTKWSLGQRTESQVSDIYVRLGNDFNVANVAFGSYGIDMSDLASVPDDLRDCLERCLSEDASPQTLEVHLPRIREIIIGLLQGLKSKQAEYKQLLMQRRASGRNSKLKTDRGMLVESAPADGVNGNTSIASNTVQRTGSNKSTASSATTTFGDEIRKSVSGKRPVNAPPISEEVGTSIQRPSSTSSSSRQSDQVRVPSRRSKRETGEQRLDSSDTGASVKTQLAGSVIESESNDGGLVFPQSQTTTSLNGNGGHAEDDSITAVNEIGDAADPSVRALKSRDALERRASKRFSAYTFNKMGVGLNQGLGMSSYGLSGTGSAMSSPVAERVVVNTPSRGSVKRPGISRSSSELQASETPTKPRDRSGLASEVISENYDLPLRKKGSRTSPRHSPKANHSTLVPPLPSIKDQANSSTESLPFVDAQSPQKEPLELEDRQPLISPEIPPVPPLPSLQEQARLDAAHGNKASGYRNMSGSKTPTAASMNLKQANTMPLFLQLGRQTKKVNVDLDLTAPLKGLSTGKLRMLFMDKFSYSPGKEDFPIIYVKDAHSGVTYELEDLTELTDGTVLTLNIEPLDQVKQHLDLTLGSITRELRDLKTAMQDRDREWGRRLSIHPPDGLSSQVNMAPRISDAQFAKAGARVAQYKRATMFFGREQPEGEEVVEEEVVGGRGVAEENKELGMIKESETADSIATSSATRPKSVAWQLAGDQLKKQYEEVLNVRRQLAIMVQIQDDFKSDVGGLLGTLREQAKRVRSIAALEVPTERNFIITGKARLDSNSQEVLTLVEDLLDMVDDLKSDVIQRGVKPKPHTMKKLGEDIDRATRGLEELSKYVDLVKPSWKKTWEMELQNIVDEQEFLNHQEGLIADLKEDHANLQDVFNNIQEVVKLRGANRFNLLGTGGNNENTLSNVSLRTYIPPAPEEGHEGLTTVMMEVKTQRPDHEKRLKALEAAEKQRLKDIHQRKVEEDDFQNELTTFVDGKALRKTGGYLETERVRGKRDKMTLNAMFGGGGVGGAPMTDVGNPPPKRLVVGTKSGGGSSDSGLKEVTSPIAGDSSTGSYNTDLAAESFSAEET